MTLPIWLTHLASADDAWVILINNPLHRAYRTSGWVLGD